MLMIKGEAFPCDWPSDDDGTHKGWGHTNKAAEAVWQSENLVPRNPVRTWYSATGPDGSLWIEDKDLQEVADAMRSTPPEFLPLTVRRHQVFEYARTTEIDQGQGLRQMLEALKDA
jgi:hypothetical protein